MTEHDFLMLGTPVYMTDGKRFRKLHYRDGATDGHAWIRAPWKKVRSYAATGLIARENLIRRMRRRGWWCV